MRLTADNFRGGLDHAQGIVLRQQALLDEVMHQAVEEKVLDAVEALPVNSRRTAAVSEIRGHMLLPFLRREHAHSQPPTPSGSVGDLLHMGAGEVIRKPRDASVEAKPNRVYEIGPG